MKNLSCPPLAGLIVLSALCLQLGGCGLKTELPSTTGPADPTAEKAVQISHVRYNNDGVQITCQINKALVSPDVSIVLFIEFDGVMVESTPLQNTEFHEFNNFIPDHDGPVMCVVVFAEAEFASDSLMLDSNTF